MYSNAEPPPSSYRAEREFGLLVGGALVLIGGWWLYRGKFGPVAYAFVAFGTALVVLGALVPRALVLPNRWWRSLGEALSVVSTTVILVVVFFALITPVGVVKRWFGWDPLRRRGASATSYWKPYAARQRDHRHYEKMY